MIYRILLILLFPFLLTAQQVSLGFDVSNALYGSEVNKPSLDIQFKVTSIESWGEIGIQYEYFNEIKYFSWGMFANKQVNITDNIKLLAGVEAIQIIRGKVGFLSYGFNAETRYWITENIGISAQYNYRWREDLRQLYDDGRFVNSGFLNIIYKWE